MIKSTFRNVSECNAFTFENTLNKEENLNYNKLVQNARGHIPPNTMKMLFTASAFILLWISDEMDAYRNPEIVRNVLGKQSCREQCKGSSIIALRQSPSKMYLR